MTIEYAIVFIQALFEKYYAEENMELSIIFADDAIEVNIEVAV